MSRERIKCIISGLKRYELTETERRFIYTAEYNLNHDGLLTERQESILEGIYCQKTKSLYDSIFSFLNQIKNEHMNPFSQKTDKNIIYAA